MYKSLPGGLWLRIVRNIRASGDKTGRYRGGEQAVKVDKEGGREIIYLEFAHVLNVVEYFVYRNVHSTKRRVKIF